MMALAIDLSARNVAEGTGGPFGSAIFERDTISDTTKLVSIGVNRVVPLGNSTLHGETVSSVEGMQCFDLFERRKF